MASAPTVDSLASYLPRRLVEQLAGVRAAQEVGQPDTFPAAALLADLSGFTALSADLARDGAIGAETLTRILDRALGGLVDLVSDSGGDVVNFAGDAVIAIWPAEDEEDLRRCVYAAAQCAERAQREIGGWEAHPGHVLDLRIGVGAGSCTFISLGDQTQRWGWVAAGEAMLEVGHAERSAEPGETVLSNLAAALLGAAAEGPKHETGVQVLRRLAHMPAPSRVRRPPANETALSAAGLEQAIRAYIPTAVLSRIDTGHTEWLAELRTVSALFVNLPDLDPAQPAVLHTVQALVSRINACIDLLGGALNKILVDGKGLTLVVGFGLPPRAYEDDGLRAVRAALRIEAMLRRQGVAFGIGVSTGRAFCGAYGNAIRREYTMLGDSVNLAARLMKRADGVVWCDAETARVAVSRVAFQDLGLQSIRGLAVDQRVHRPLGAHDSIARRAVMLTGRDESLGGQSWPVDPQRARSQSQLPGTGDPGPGDPEPATPPRETERPHELEGRRLVGREAQEQVLVDRLERLGRGERGLVLVEGEAGMGKSFLLATLHREASSRDLSVLSGTADPVRSHEPYHAWREVFGALFGATAGAKPDLSRWFPPDSRLAEWVPLLGPVLGLEIEQTASTTAMNGPQRADATQDLLVAALTRAVEARPVLIELDDGHWMDAASWQLALNVAQRVPGLLLVLGHRTMSIDAPRAFTALTELPTAQRVRLDAMPDHRMSQLACHFLGVMAISPSVQRLLVSRAAGNPFFCEELAHALRDADALELQFGSIARFAPGHSAETVSLPGTLQSVVVSRLDRLPPEEQLTMKVASVLGRSFDVDTLRAVHPAGHTEAELLSQLDHLSKLGLCPRERGVGEHAFKHAMVQEACYELLVLSTRRALHAAAASHYESPGSGEERNATRLAHHWRLAGMPVRALHHLESAGFEALENGWDRDALGSLEAARDLLSAMNRSQRSEVGKVREAELLRGIGTALLGVGRPEASADSLRQSLQTLGRGLPTTSAGWVVRLLLEGARQLAYRVLPRFLRWNAPAHRHEELRAASKAASWYAHTSYFRVYPLPWLAAGLLSANLAENAKAPEIAGTAYVNLANIFGTLHLRRIERAYMRLAALSTQKRVGILAHSSEAVVDMLHCAWDDARVTIGSGTAKARAAGDWWALGNGLIIQALIQYLSGPIADSLPTFDETVRLMKARSHPAQEAYGRVFSVSPLLALGRVDEAWEQLADGESRFDSYDYFGQLSWHAGRAALLWELGDPDEAVASAVRALRMYAAKPLTVFTYVGPFSLIADVLLAARADGRALGTLSPEEIAQHAQSAVANLSKGAKLFWYFRPRALLARGVSAAQDGHPDKARQAWQKGLEAAVSLGMPWDTARLHVELARHAAPGTAERSAHERAAREILEPMGAAGTLGLLA